MLYKTYLGASIDERTVMTLEDAKLDSVSTKSNTTASHSLYKTALFFTSGFVFIDNKL